MTRRLLYFVGLALVGIVMTHTINSRAYFLDSHIISPPSVTEFDGDDVIRSMDDLKSIFDGLGMKVEIVKPPDGKTVKLEFVETRFEITPEGNGHTKTIGFWMPTKPSAILDDFVFVSKPGVITYETVMLAYELLRSL